MVARAWVLFTVLVASFVAANPAWAADNYVIRDQPLAETSLTIVDERPAKELKGGLPLLFDPTYSVPDKRFTPPLLAVFASALQEKLGDQLAGKALAVQRLQVQNYFRATYEKGQASTLFITGGVAGAVVAAIDGKERVDAVRFRLQGTVDGVPFSVEIAAPYEAGKTSGMVYNGANARAATAAIAQRGIDAGVEAVRQVLESGGTAAAAPAAP
jgi:hypothetical protein